MQKIHMSQIELKRNYKKNKNISIIIYLLNFSEPVVQNKPNLNPNQQLIKSLNKEKNVFGKNLTDFRNEINDFTEKEQILQQKSIDILTKIYKYVDGIQKKVYENDETLKSIHKTLEIQNEICSQLDVVQEKLDKSKTLAELSMEKDKEILKHIKEQNNILLSHLEKLENKE